MGVEQDFYAAQDYIKSLPTNGPVQLTTAQKLEFYGLFKQASQGDCDEKAPSRFQMVKKYKYDAWNSLKGTSKANAMSMYLSKLETLSPGWKKNLSKL